LSAGTRSTRWRRALVALAAAIVLLALLLLARRPLLTGLADWLTVDTPPTRADAIFVLNGGENTRPLHAAALWRAGYAPRVVIARVNEGPAIGLVRENVTDLATDLLQMHGVPRDAIVVLRMGAGITSTAEEARAFAAYTRTHALDTVIVVTSAFHGRRSRWVFRREVPAEIIMSTAADWQFDETNWWHYERGLITYIQEYIKFLHYVLR
jgi:uncharacterized SAM-binding protein YcdF (DUF218 family)